MKGSWKGAIVVLTGGSSGIGAAMAREFVRRGATVVATARSEDKLLRLSAELGERCAAYTLDVTSDDDVRKKVEAIVSRFGKIDVWVNNAGYGRFEPFLGAAPDSFHGMMDVNYFGVVRCTQAVLPHMLKAGKGHIVNVASLAGKVGSAKGSAYSASKHAVLGLTNSLRQELGGTGVYLTAVNPGPIDTPFFDLADPSGHYVQNVKAYLLKPEKVAEKVADAVERRKKEIDLPFTLAVGTKLYQLFPRVLDVLAGRLLNKK